MRSSVLALLRAFAYFFVSSMVLSVWGLLRFSEEGAFHADPPWWAGWLLLPTIFVLGIWLGHRAWVNYIKSFNEEEVIFYDR
jgi:hypothetical protein